MSEPVLHLVQGSATDSSALKECLRSCRPTDCLVLMHDALYAALAPLNIQVKAVYALREEAQERGLEHTLEATVTLIDYSELVELCARHRHCQSWF